jgi:hypothetical protein
MAYLDFKITSWKRVRIPDEKVEEVIQKLKEGGCDAPYDLLDEDDDCYIDSCGIDLECEEPMTVEENGGCSTQELYDNKDKIIYRNGTADDE